MICWISLKNASLCIFIYQITHVHTFKLMWLNNVECNCNALKLYEWVAVEMVINVDRLMKHFSLFSPSQTFIPMSFFVNDHSIHYCLEYILENVPTSIQSPVICKNNSDTSFQSVMLRYWQNLRQKYLVRLCVTQLAQFISARSNYSITEILALSK